MQDDRSGRESFDRMPHPRNTPRIEPRTGETERADWAVQRQPHELGRYVPHQHSGPASYYSPAGSLNWQPHYHPRAMPPTPMSYPIGTTVSSPNGSHQYRGADFVGCKSITIGNSSSDYHGSYGHPPYAYMSGHTYQDIRIAHSQGVHCGNTGSASEGHNYNGLRVEEVEGSHFGDFADTNMKYANLQAARNDARQYQTGA
ncbi:hypothetical protein NPX13_g25 [Xylaria arbuscula]|uniref:Uncharacterized protein n=1 Tax=Xylaria arbuscula TaxID=114810 RepID=A0A9W8NPH5_9PEZI|nr:hypothetical protein NPX13_g25 [Xylaria arbuscula]